MKISKDLLKEMIKEVILENRKKTLVLEEPTLTEARQPKYEMLMDILKGKTDVKTVGIMSGQNPMAQSTSPEKNKELKGKLEAKLKELGLTFVRIGGIFGGHPEKSVVILNPSKDQMDILNRQFKQWGFVFGKKIPMNKEKYFMAFTMYEIDYDNKMGFRKAPGSKETGFVVPHSDLEDVDDNVSFDPTSKKKFGLELYEEGEE
mgnify:CR=1 FL=1